MLQWVDEYVLSSAEIAVAGATMVTHGNCLYVFGGMDEERQEQMTMWRWNLSAEEGFESITYRHSLWPSHSCRSSCAG